MSVIGWDNRWVGDSTIPWRNTTHDWASSVDAGHLAEVRRHPARFAPGGVLHLVLEVIAYVADEAESTAAGRCIVTLHNDGSVSVADNGRGTETRYHEQGRPIRKPVMATKDLRSRSEQKLAVDLNNPEFLRSWFSLRETLNYGRREAL